ncbi:LacI family DNA-binding transcriptional regulator [uncultured Victivallis sp.]|uniref:LacI family DNA-binding transcriptional regulator n=1 Tax=uncultured Victivallis sp. TaxID=354118 RepID=UPI0025D742E9|nr:LacI family DNA-binding transcriptional regulator [uncultured Victivallis sp.]
MSMTIKAIAEASGVSAATVSRIINGTARVAPEKRAKVLAVMGERREPIRRRERTSRGINIGVLLLPEAHFDSFSMLDKLCELTDTLPRKSILTLLSPNILPQALEGSFRRGELSGMLIGGHRIESEDLRRVVERIPHVWLNSHWLEESEKNILMGNEFAGRLAARYLKKCGCRMPAVLRLASLNPGYAAQCDGFLFEYFSMKQECLCIELKFPSASDLLETAEESILEQLLESKELENADGFFFPEERLTTLYYRQQMKRGVPVRHPVVSCNHTPRYLCGYYPRPATVDLGPRQLARLALNELLDIINDGNTLRDKITTIVTPLLTPGELYDATTCSENRNTGVLRSFSMQDAGNSSLQHSAASERSDPL